MHTLETKPSEAEILPPLAPNHAVVIAAPVRKRRRCACAMAAASASGLLLLVLHPWTAAPHTASGCGYYTAAGGEKVRRPCGNWRDGGGERPKGATARCGDGTWSYSRRPNSPGTCSGHGGVVRD